MTSIKAKLINFSLRNRHLMQGRLHKEKFDLPGNMEQVLAFRRTAEEGAARMFKQPGDIEIETFEIDGMEAEWVRPVGFTGPEIIFYVHGGGYVSGNCQDHRGVVSKLVQYTGIPCLVYSYRLAPEHPFPAAMDDSLSVFRWLLVQGQDPQQVVFAGESAGGGLMLALLLGIKQTGLPMPRAVVALSPWTDLTCSGASYQTRKKVCLAPENSWTVFGNCYTAGQDPTDPLISPLFGDLAGLPPLLIIVGDHETMRDDSVAFAEKAEQAGVETTLVVKPEMVHCFPFFAPIFPEAEEEMQRIVGFMRARLGVG